MHFLSAESMRDLDRKSIDRGTPGEVLMGRASSGLARELMRSQRLSPNRQPSCLIVAGTGNNGGDGFGLASELIRSGWRVDVMVAGDASKIGGDAKTFLDRALASGVNIQFFNDPSDWPSSAEELPVVDWVVDALLGTGSRGAPEGVIAAAVELIRSASGIAQVVAIDLPTGLDADTGEATDPARTVVADVTLTLGAPKIGFSKPGAGAWTGSVETIPLGFDPGELSNCSAGSVSAICGNASQPLRGFRSHDGHKGTFGHVLVVGGSQGMTGSVGLAAMAALRAGAGLVTVLTPASCAKEVDQLFPEIMVIAGQEGKDGTLSVDAWNALRGNRDFDAVVLGPGLRVTKDTETLVRGMLFDCDAPLVIDADGINVATGRTQWLFRARSELVLTPHPGELGRLMSMTIDEVQENRVAAVEQAASDCDATIILKGAGSLVAHPGQKTRMNLNGNPGMATAGSGDILAGFLAGILAQGIPMQSAADAAVYLHGRAGDLAALRKGKPGMVARDILDALAEASI